MAEAASEALIGPTRSTPAKVEQRFTENKPSGFPPAPVYPTFKTPAHLPKPPFVDIDGIPNFRDLGGYLCTPANIAGSTGEKSHVVRKAFLYRCAHPTQITSTGVKTFSDKLHIKAIYDLRSEPEVLRTNAAAASGSANGGAGSATPDVSVTATAFDVRGATRYFTPVFTGEDYSPDGLARRLRWYTTGTSPDPPRAGEIGPYSPGFVNAYRDILNHGVMAYTKIFNHILHAPNDSLVFHCTAGKDRTGVFAALVLRLAGVDDETICWEYALTEPGLGAWRDLFIKRMTEHGLKVGPNENSTATKEGTYQVEMITHEEAANICGSKAGNMRAFLKLVLDEEHAGVEAYLKDRCGFSNEEIEKIRSNLVLSVDKAREDDIVVPVSIQGWTPEGGIQDLSK